MVFLGDQADLGAQLLQGQLEQRDAAEPYRAGSWSVDPGQQAPEGGFAGAARSDDGEPFAGADGQVEAVQDVATGQVGEPDVGRDQPLTVGAGSGGTAVGGHVGDPDQPGQRGGADLQLVDPAEQPVERVDEQLHVQGDGRDLGQGSLAAGVQGAAEQDHPDDGQHERQVDQRKPDHPQPQGVPLDGVGSSDLGLALAQSGVLAAQGLDGPRAVGGLGQPGGDLGVRRPFAQIASGRAAQVPAGRKPQDRAGDEHRARHLRCGQEGGRDGQDGRQRGNQHLGDGVADGLAQRVDVGGRAAEQVAGSGPFDRRQRERDDPFEEVFA